MTIANKAGTGGMSSLDRTMAVLLSLVFVDTFSYALVLPLLPFVVKRYGLSVALIGIVFATYSLCQLICAPLLGHWSDYLGRRPLLIVSQFGSAVGFLMLALSTSLPMIVLSRVVDGITAGNIGIVNAVVLDRYPLEVWGSRFAQLGSAVGLGILLGLSGSALLAPRGLTTVAFVALGLAVVSTNLTLWLLPETRRGHQMDVTRPWKTVWVPRATRLRRIVAAGLLSTIVQSAFLLALPLYLSSVLGYDAQRSAIFIAVIIAAGAVGQLTIVPRAFRAFGEQRSAQWGFVLVLVGGTLAAGARDVVLVTIAGLVVTFGIVTLNPSFTALLGKCTDVLDEGALMGINQSMSSAGQLLGPPLGYLALGFGKAAGYGIVCACLAAVGGTVTMRLGAERA